MSGTLTRRNALLSLAAGAALISTSPVWVKLAQVTPTAAAFYRMAFGALFLLLWMLWRRARPNWRGGFLALAVLAALFLAFDLYFWHRSILYVGPGLATVLANFQVFALASIGMLFLGERPTWRFAAGLLLAMVGLWLLVGLGWQGYSGDYRRGVLFGLLTACCYSGYLLTLRRAQRDADAGTPGASLLIVTVLCALLLATAVQSEGGAFAIPDSASLACLLVYGLTAQCAGWLLIIRALPRVPAALAGLLLLLQPALAFVWDVFLFDRAMLLVELIGLGLALAGIFVGSLRNERAVLRAPSATV